MQRWWERENVFLFIWFERYRCSHKIHLNFRKKYIKSFHLFTWWGWGKERQWEIIKPALQNQKTLNKDKSPGREHIKLLIAILAFYWFYFIGFIPAMAIPMRIGKEECCCLASSAVSDSFVTPWTIACQAPLTMGFPRWEYWSGLPFLSPGDVAYPREIEPTSPALQADSFPLSQWGSQNKG